MGVDIDEALIRAAWRRRLTAWSQQAAYDTAGQQRKDSKKRKRDEIPTVPEPDYFPAAFEHMFGSLPVPPSQNRGKEVFPHNISFRTGNWVKDLDAVPEDKEGYDVVVACVLIGNFLDGDSRNNSYRFSVSKWIHLNEGDEGLKTFFRRVHDVLRPGGVFILEPQPWESYRKARRILHSVRGSTCIHFSYIILNEGFRQANVQRNFELSIRPGNFRDVLSQLGFDPPQHLCITGEEGTSGFRVSSCSWPFIFDALGFRRPVEMYTRPHINPS